MQNPAKPVLKKLSETFQTRAFGLVVSFLGVTFLLLTLCISLDPEPFLRFGYLGVFVFNLFGPGTLLIPSLSGHMNVYSLALATSLGMAFNDSVSWLIGRSGGKIIPYSKKFAKVQGFIERFGLFGLLFLSFLPLPYDFIGLIAGYLKLPYKKFLFPTFVGRFVRMMLLGLGVLVLKR